MKRKILFFILMVFIGFSIFAEKNFSVEEFSEEKFSAEKEDTGHPSLSLVFHNMGWNFLHSFTCNYGANFIVSGLGTWALIESGIDWKWRNNAYNNTWISNLGRPGLYGGVAIPALTPIITYAVGWYTNDEKLQITGMALVQTIMLTFAIQSPLKMITGRAKPGIVNEVDQKRDPRTENFSAEFNLFNMDAVAGWPSGHTANAFSAAATISEIYSENIWLKIGVFTYAAIIGFGVTLDVHWASEALAGALIGYAIGSTVGKSYKKLLDNKSSNDPADNNVSFYFTTNSVGMIIKI